MAYKYSFSGSVPMDDVEDSLMLAALAAEGLHGRSAVMLDAAFCLDKRRRTCLIDAETQIGRDIALIFARYMAKGFGEQAFRVDRTCDRVPAGDPLLCADKSS